MTSQQQVFVVLLRGINVGGHNKIPMKELRSLCEGLGWTDVQSYIQSGNLLVTTDAAKESLEEELEQAIERRFGISIPVIARYAGAWSNYIENNPFVAAAGEDPSRVMLALSKHPITEGAAERLQEYAAAGERVAAGEDVLYGYFPSGAAVSKLTPALFDRLVGSSVTVRNWRTVLKLGSMLQNATR